MSHMKPQTHKQRTIPRLKTTWGVGVVREGVSVCVCVCAGGRGGEGELKTVFLPETSPLQRRTVTQGTTSENYFGSWVGVFRESVCSTVLMFASSQC